ncbi:MAG: hypothetical protein Q9165_003370 [Trypethelium subeluteriae]
MALNQTSAPIPISIEPWLTAKAHFLSGLSNEEKVVFRDATPENLFDEARVAHKNHLAISKFTRLTQKLQPLVEAFADLSDILDVYANASALILCPLWGSVRVLLHVSQAFGKYFEKLIDMFARIGDALPRFRVYAHLFPEYETLLRALSGAYLDVVHFCVDVKQVFSKSTRSLVNWSITCRALWSPLKSKLDEYIVSFRWHAKQVEKEAGLSHMIEAKKARTLDEARQQLLKQNKEREERCRIFNNLSTIRYESIHQRVKDVRHDTTGDWLLEDSSFKEWLKSSSSSSFSVWGIPGAGKTVLTSRIVDELLSVPAKAETKMCYFYCDYADQETLDPSRIIGCLARQLLQGMENIPRDIMQRVQRIFAHGSGYPTRDELESLFAECVDAYPRVLLVIDGVDELAKVEQKILLRFIKSLMSRSCSNIKVMVSSRREEREIRIALDWEYSVDLNVHNMSPDIETYTRASIDTKIKEGELIFADPSLRGEIIDALISGAKDMFLWVRFQIDDICDAIGDEAIRNTIKNLPHDVEETYVRILEKVSRRPNGTEKLRLVENVFKWTLVARRPLTIDELKEAIIVSKADTSLQTAKMDAGDGSRIIDACANLISFDRSDRSVRFAHHTIKQFLLVSQQTIHANRLSQMDLSDFDMARIDTEIGEKCVSYLNFSDFDTALVQPGPKCPMEPATFDTNIWKSALQVGRLWSIISHLREHQKEGPLGKPCQLDLGRFRGSRSPSVILKSKYQLLEYVTFFWTQHCANLPRESSIWSLFCHLIRDRKLEFSFRPWEICSIDTGIYDSPSGTDLFRWAVQNGFLAFLRYIESVSHEPLSDTWQDTEFINHITHSVRGGSLNMIVLYYCWEKQHGLSPLLRALQSGKAEVIDFLCRNVVSYVEDGGTKLSVWEVLDDLDHRVLLAATELPSLHSFQTLLRICESLDGLRGYRYMIVERALGQAIASRSIQSLEKLCEWITKLSLQRTLVFDRISYFSSTGKISTLDEIVCSAVEEGHTEVLSVLQSSPQVLHNR